MVPHNVRMVELREEGDFFDSLLVVGVGLVQQTLFDRIDILIKLVLSQINPTKPSLPYLFDLQELFFVSHFS